jgi:hypothetical protein
MVIGVMKEEPRRHFVLTVSGVMHEQIPGMGNQCPGQENAADDEVDDCETSPYLPENDEDRFVRTGVMPR